MSKITQIAVMCLVLIGCTNTSDTKDNIAEDVIEQIDTVLEEELITEEKIGFTKFEDYAEIKTKEELISQFGLDNLKDDTSWYAEGTVMMMSTVLINPTNKQTIKFVWGTDNNQLSHIEAYYYVRDKNYEIIRKQKIETNCGFYTGMSLTALSDWNEGDIKFSGFGWDYEGGLFLDTASKLSKCPVRINLMLEQVEGEEFNELYGDVELKSNSNNVKDAPIVVDKLTLYIES